MERLCPRTLRADVRQQGRGRDRHASCRNLANEEFEGAVLQFINPELRSHCPGLLDRASINSHATVADWIIGQTVIRVDDGFRQFVHPLHKYGAPTVLALW